MNQATLSEAIEVSLFSNPELPNRLRYLPVAGTRGWMSSLPYPKANYVGVTRVGPEQYADTIDKVLTLFAKTAQGFTWVVGPEAQSKNLSGELLAAGLHQSGEMCGMVYDLEKLTTPVKQSDRVVETNTTQWSKIVEIMSKAFNSPLEICKLYHDAYTQRPDHHQTQIYSGLAENTVDPVAFAYLSYLPGQTALFRAAGTLEEHRGKGIYSDLIHKRLADAKRDGMKIALTQAYPDTSASSLSRSGFLEVCTLELYQWSPSC